MADHLPVHVLDYGDSGVGKSTFAATFPKPMLVWHFDPYGKDTPYLDKGTPSDLFSDDKAAFVRHVMSKRDPERLLIRIEYYHELGFIEPELMTLPKSQRIRLHDLNPEAYSRFLTRVSRVHEEYGQYKTIVLDSATFMEIAARRWDQHTINPMTEDPRQWWAGSTDMLEQMLMVRFASFPMNVVTICHIDREKAEASDTMLRSPAAPGRLRGNLSVAYSELYHQYMDKDGQPWLQTRSNTMYNAATRIGAPPVCKPTYRAIWGEE